jgi:hypothetical protein
VSELRSPVSGRPLAQDGPHALSDGAGERWPVIEGVAYLRAGSRERADATLACLDSGDRTGALALLLAENDGWWDEPPPPEAELRRLVEDADGPTPPTLRDAMARLGWGRVGVYFAHRWSDPTFVAGLALTDAHWTAPASALELCCGIGHHLRALQDAGVAVTGGDVVFSKLWVARRWVLSPSAALVCFDAEHEPWPVGGPFDLVSCHDAFYFLQDKAAVAGRLRALAGEGALVLSHVHNRDWPNLSGGAAVSAAELAALFPDALAYDDAELTRAGAERRAPEPKPWGALGGVEAFSLVDGAARAAGPKPVDGPLSRPPLGAALVRNPLLAGHGRIAWPSERYREEYGPRATYGRHAPPPERAVMSAATAAAAARRDLLHLPEAW